jgi:hypothetical protein
MKALAGVGLLTAAVIGLRLLPGDTDSTDTTPPTPTTAAVTATAELDVDGLPPRIEYPGTLDCFCDELGHPFGVEPDEPDAWTSAERGCLRLHIATGRAPWPDGIRPLP